MTKEQKLEAIYEAMADKTLNFGCLIKTKDGAYETIDEVTIYTQGNYIEQYCLGDERTRRLDICLIIGHPVRIGDVLKYIDTNCCFVDDGEGNKSRDMKALDAMLHSVFYNFVGKQDRPIDEQDELCIAFVYNLIKK